MSLHAALLAIDCITIFSMLLVSTNMMVAFPRSKAARLVAFVTLCSAAEKFLPGPKHQANENFNTHDIVPTA